MVDRKTGLYVPDNRAAVRQEDEKSFDLLVAEKILLLSPTLRETTKQGFKIGVITQQDLDNPQEIASVDELLATSRHEAGHIVGVFSVGASFNGADVIQRGHQLGVTKFAMNPNASLAENLLNITTISFCSEAAESLYGLSHEGCASDHAQAEAYADLFAQLHDTNPVGEALARQMLSRQRSRAYNIIEAAGKNRIDQIAWRLVKHKTIATV